MVTILSFSKLCADIGTELGVITHKHAQDTAITMIERWKNAILRGAIVSGLTLNLGTIGFCWLGWMLGNTNIPLWRYIPYHLIFANTVGLVAVGTGGIAALTGATKDIQESLGASAKPGQLTVKERKEIAAQVLKNKLEDPEANSQLIFAYIDKLTQESPEASHLKQRIKLLEQIVNRQDQLLAQQSPPTEPQTVDIQATNLMI